VKTIRGNPEGIPSHWDGESGTAFLEGFNSVSGAVKRKARGYGSTDYRVTMPCFVAGRLSTPSYPNHGK